jgi:hypothetical protein
MSFSRKHFSYYSIFKLRTLNAILAGSQIGGSFKTTTGAAVVVGLGVVGGKSGDITGFLSCTL